MIALARKWLPGEALTTDTLGDAIYLEKRYWASMSHAVQSGINRAFNG